MAPEFAKRGVKMCAVSCNDAQTHSDWIKDIQEFGSLKGKFPYPIIDDVNRELATKLGMLDPAEKDSKGMAVTARAVFVIGKDKKMKLSLLYPATTGRNFE